jgi:tetratricopeptide (TPR) repeat protein
MNDAFKTKLAELEKQLRVGNFRAALPLVDEMCQDGFLATLRRLPAGTPLRARAAAALAEVLFYRGHNEKARELVAGAAPQARFLSFGDEVPTRAKLQLLVEHDYSLGDFERASIAAKQIRRQCEERKNPWGMGEALYYLARCCMRVHKPLAVYDACDKSIESFVQAAAAERRGAPEVQWRIGLVLLVGGYTSWDAGHNTARLKLLTARSLLAATGDIVSRANVEQTIGTVLRSQRRSQADFAQALEAFDAARTAYRAANHQLNLARVLTNMGRTFLHMGEPEKARQHFEEALGAAHGEGDEPRKRRQRAETLVCMSWLYRETGDHAQAAACARSALGEASKISRRYTAEALMALGDCQLAAGSLREAQSSFDEALTEATGTGIAKLRVKAHLHLAELQLQHGDVRLAASHHQRAVGMLTPSSSRYLREKANHVRRLMRDDVWVITKKDLSDFGLAQAKTGLSRWAIRTVEVEPNLTLRAKARRLKMSGPGYLQLCRRASGRDVAAGLTVAMGLPPVPEDEEDREAGGLSS